MALQAAGRIVHDALLEMFLIQFAPVMAFKAVVIGCVAHVASRTTPIGVPMVEWECVPIDMDAGPIAGIVALRTLPTEVVIGPVMAR